MRIATVNYSSPTVSDIERRVIELLETPALRHGYFPNMEALPRTNHKTPELVNAELRAVAFKGGK